MFNNLNQREKILIIIAFLLIILVVYYFYLYQPIKSDIAHLKQEKLQKHNRVKTARDLAVKLPALKKKYKQLSKQREKKSKLLTQDKSTVEILRKMEELAGKNNVELVSFNPSENKNRVNINLSFQGSYTRVCKLFNDFSDLSKGLEFKKLKLYPQNREIVNVAMSVSFYKGGIIGGDN